ncbi:30S ribosomal protein S18 [Dehalococcoides sp. THU3]|uniref:30S ribosomal protein S18 n=1 Tax=Dehalococcoides TaxID=61434 RepID=UPI0005B56816|nr:30S ribosomal protein S18 [Dehalococcoides sp. UCH007]
MSIQDRPNRPARGGRGRYTPKRKICSFCAEKVSRIDYKDSAKLARYISDRGKIEPRRRTGTCARHQRALANAIKRARFIALMPFVSEHVRRQGNVATFSPMRELRPEPKMAEPKVESKVETKAEVAVPEVKAEAAPAAEASESAESA